MRALILEGRDPRSALAATRALAAAGWTVGVGSERRRDVAASSRFCARWHSMPDVDEGAATLADGINAATSEGGYEVVFGCGDAETMALSGAREHIVPRVPYAQHPVVVRSFDKFELVGAAQRAGLAAPRTWVDGHAPPGRIVVKPRLHAATGGAVHLATVVVDGAEGADRRATEIRAAGGSPLFQEHVAGSMMAFSAVAEERGRIVAASQQSSDRLYPPEAGISSRARTVSVDAQLRARVEAMLMDLGWFGLVQLQFVVPTDGIPRLIDFNGRFYGSLALAVAGGVNLPAIWAALATGRPVPAGQSSEPGRRYQWLQGDLLRAVHERRHGMLVDLAGACRYAVGATHSVWRGDDPAPAVRLVAQVMRSRAAGVLNSRAA